jgi:hypothetical protein
VLRDDLAANAADRKEIAHLYRPSGHVTLELVGSVTVTERAHDVIAGKHGHSDAGTELYLGVSAEVLDLY